MFLRQLKYLAALAREKHFLRAAKACNVTQSTLSLAIRRLEAELGVPIVVRGHRFLGLTPEGESVLAWAHQMLADYDALRQDLSRVRGGLAGTLRIGVIPATLPAVVLFTTPFSARHPLVKIQIVSMSSIAIQRGLDDREIDVGLTYLDNEPLKHVRTHTLYRERYVFATAAGGPYRGQDSISWREAATAPLCLLSGDMQNRRIIDAIFARVGVTMQPRIETNSFVSICSHIRAGIWSTILPHSYLHLFGTMREIHAIPLVDPIHSHAIGLVVPDRDPISPVASALMRVARGLDVERELMNSPAGRILAVEKSKRSIKSSTNSI
jgi:DNA-binding transcriptional LysR family regulator